MQWYVLSQADIIKKLKTNTHNGLTQQEVQRRLKKNGYNELPREKKIGMLLLLLRQVQNVMVYMLLIAAAISLLLGEFVDMWVILAAVILNIIVGFIQENKAQNALFALRQVLTPTSIVIREGEHKEIESRELVEGDIVVLDEGASVPADLRIIEAHNLTISESSLTGEAQPQKKKVGKLRTATALADRVNMAFMGTNVVQGSGYGVVVATALNTEIGTIAHLVATTKEELTPLQERLKVFSAFLGKTVLGIAAVILFFGLLRGHSFGEMFTVAVAVAVAAIPEGLAVEVTVILAIGMQQILNRNGLVKKLVAAETLGSITVICTDKTGTLTEGSMRVTHIATAGTSTAWSAENKKTSVSEEVMQVLRIGMFCNNATIATATTDDTISNLAEEQYLGDPTETALIRAARMVGLYESEKKKVQRVDVIPFSSDAKFMATLDKLPEGKKRLHAKGAPEIIVEHCSHILIGTTVQILTPLLKKKVVAHFESMNKKGMRTLGVAYSEENAHTTKITEKSAVYTKKLTYVGTVGMRDPLRVGVKDTIELCQSAGIIPVLITGDHKLTALSIARELGLPSTKSHVIDGARLTKLSDSQLAEQVQNFSVYARVSPKDKLRIVDAWQKRGEVVAMTGDGVNDAPALKAADIGVALGSGTDVTKGVADLVLLDNNFSTIVRAVEQGRVIFENIRKVALYLLSDSFSEVVVIVGSLLIAPLFLSEYGELPLPLLASQILWINLVTDGLPDIALIFEPKEKEVMQERPLPRKTPLFDIERKIYIFVISIVSGIFALTLFIFYMRTTGDVLYARTVVFAMLGIDSLIYVFSSRTLRQLIFSYNPFRNPWLILAVIGGAILQLLALYLPYLQHIFKTVSLSMSDWTIILIFCFGTVVISEITKAVFLLKKKYSTKRNVVILKNSKGKGVIL